MQVLSQGSDLDPAQLYMTVFRPAAIEKLDKRMSNINIPVITKKATDQNPTAYYFGCIRQVHERLLPSAPSPSRLPSHVLTIGSKPFSSLSL